MPEGSSSVHYDAVLTDAAVAFDPPDLSAEKLWKPYHVVHESDVYPVFDKSMFDTADDIRADGDEAKVTDQGWTYAPYRVDDHALKDRVTKRERENSDDPDMLEMRKSQGVKQKVKNNLEKRMFGTNGICRTAANFISSLANQDISNDDTADPRFIFDQAKSVVEIACGHTPNTIIAQPTFFRAIMRTAQWRDETKYTQDISRVNDIPTEMYGMATMPIWSLLNSAKKGQAPTLTRLMGTDVAVAYIAPGASLPYMGVTWGGILYTEEYVLKYWKDENRAWFLEYGYTYVPQLVAKECAVLLPAVNYQE